MFTFEFAEFFNAAAEMFLGAELCGEEGADDVANNLRAYEPGAEAKDVDVVVDNRLPRHIRVHRDRGSNTGDLVGGDAGSGGSRS